MENEMEVELLNVVKYTTNDNRKRTILRFISLDKDTILDNDKFKGINVIDTYYDGFEVFDKIPKDLFGRKVVIQTKTITSASNPLLQILKVVKINDIDLV